MHKEIHFGFSLYQGTIVFIPSFNSWKRLSVIINRHLSIVFKVWSLYLLLCSKMSLCLHQNTYYRKKHTATTRFCNCLYLTSLLCFRLASVVKFREKEFCFVQTEMALPKNEAHKVFYWCFVSFPPVVLRRLSRYELIKFEVDGNSCVIKNNSNKTKWAKSTSYVILTPGQIFHAQFIFLHFINIGKASQTYVI